MKSNPKEQTDKHKVVGMNQGGRTHNPGPKIQCLNCGDIIQSMFRHDFKWCACKSIAVDGGGDYLKMTYTDGAQYLRLEEEDDAEDTKRQGKL